MTKSELRMQLRERRRMFVAARGSNQFCSKSFSTLIDIILNKKDIIASFYIAAGSECDVMPSLMAVPELAECLALPCAHTKADPLIFRHWQPGDALEKSLLGFAQPLNTMSEVSPDIILTPLLGFDRNCARLGQGAGHYDRAFTAFPDALRIGIAWSCQEIPEIPLDPWDMPLDAVLTEAEWIISTASRLEPAS
jgi:5-formyltetrahydrofolate cyclo-ligase